MSEFKDAQENILKTFDIAKSSIQSLLDNVSKKEHDHNIKVKEHEESYAKRLEELEESTAATCEANEEAYAQKLKSLADEKQQQEEQSKVRIFKSSRSQHPHLLLTFQREEAFKLEFTRLNSVPRGLVALPTAVVALQVSPRILPKCCMHVCILIYVG